MDRHILEITFGVYINHYKEIYGSIAAFFRAACTVDSPCVLNLHRWFLFSYVSISVRHPHFLLYLKETKWQQRTPLAKRNLSALSSETKNGGNFMTKLTVASLLKPKVLLSHLDFVERRKGNRNLMHAILLQCAGNKYPLIIAEIILRKQSPLSRCPTIDVSSAFQQVYATVSLLVFCPEVINNLGTKVIWAVLFWLQ